jgi:exodeoxyribonuclease VII large subunit
MAAEDQLGFAFQPPARRVWTVRDLVASVRTELEREFGDAWVEGEISNFRPAKSGHLYFTLKDEGGQIRVVIFRTQARLLRFRPQDGMQVIIRGRVTIYEGRGELQIVAEHLEPKGAGSLQIAFEQLKARLQAEGLFDAARKKPVPALPRRIGIVTSPRAAALQDMLNILRRRHHSASIVIYPAQVQGDAAAAEVAEGVRYFNREHDVGVIVIARGGGSFEDLACFSDETLARTVAESAIPVISAVGHETDFTILDFVADLRAPTPSAAAELVIRSRQEIESRVEDLARRVEKAMRYQLLMRRQTLSELTQHRGFARMMDLVRRRQQQVDELVYHLAHAQRDVLERQRRRFEKLAAAVQHYDLRVRLTGFQRELENRTATLAAAMRAGNLQRRSRLERLSERLQALSPLAILDRGYALVFDGAGKLVKDAVQVAAGDEISARLARGSLHAVVKGEAAPAASGKRRGRNRKNSEGGSD